MPITPLHFGAIPILNRLTKRRMSEGAFVLTNCVFDLEIVAHMMQIEFHTKWSGPLAGEALHAVASHSFVGALVYATVIGLFGFLSARWWIGCYLGAITHVLFDMLVHSDMMPFGPWYRSNPFYIDGAYHVISIILMVGLVVWILESLDQSRAVRLKARKDRQAAAI